MTLTAEGFATVGILEREMRTLEARNDEARSLIERLSPVAYPDLRDAWHGRPEDLSRAIKSLIENDEIERLGGARSVIRSCSVLGERACPGPAAPAWLRRAPPKWSLVQPAS